METSNQSITELQKEIERLRKEVAELKDQAREKENAEEALIEREQQMSLFSLATNDMLWNWDLESGTIERNIGFEKAFGYLKEEIVPNIEWWVDRLHPEDRDRVLETYTQTVESGANTCTYDYRFRCRDGNYAIIADKVFIVRDENGDAVRSLGAMTDVTEIRRAEAALKESEERMKLALEGTDEGLWDWDVNSGAIVYDENSQRLLGYTPGEAAFDIDWWERHIHSDSKPVFEAALNAYLEGRNEYYELEYQIRSKSGEWKWIWARGICVAYDKEGRPLRMIGTHRDITERKQAEEALDLQSQIVRNMSEGVNIVRERDGVIVYTNPRFEKMFGYDSGELIGRHVSVLNAPSHKDPEETATEIIEAFKEKRLWEGEVRNIRKDGTEFWSYASVSPFKDPQHGNVLITTQLDITERKRFEQEFLKMEKLESLGQLAGGLAHDFNNLLTSIMGNVSLAKMFAEQGEDVGEILTEAENASSRARELTHQLLTFSKGGAPIKKTESIDALVRESSTFALRGSNVRFDLSIPRDLWSAEVDQGQISQVIHNLVINAQQSMPEGGLIRITCENIMLAEADPIPLEQGSYIRISITDQGHGISEERLAKIFDPYFTTKQKGSGLGLATAYSIIQRHNGFITANSQIGAGATFTIYLPASHKKPITRKELEEEVLHGQGRILVVDDEAMVRTVSAHMLSSLGYDTELAKDGEEAIDLYKDALESGNPFAAVIMDLTIPGGMGGKEAIKRLRDFDTDVVAIVSSGYSTDSIMSEYEKYGFRGVMAKPYKLKEVSRILRDLLGGSP